MAGVLDRVPFLAGYQQQGAMDQQRALGEGQQVTQAMGILGALQQQAARAQEAQRMEQARGVLSKLRPDASSEEVMGAMRPFVSPEHVYQWTQQAEMKKAQQQQTQQLAMSRLQQTIARDTALIEARARSATTAEERLHWEKQKDARLAAGQQQAADIAAGRYNFDTGNVVPAFNEYVAQNRPPTPAAPQAGGDTFSFRLPGGQMLQGNAPAAQAEQIGMAALPPAQGMQWAPPQGAATAPQPQPAAATVAPPPLVPSPVPKRTQLQMMRDEAASQLGIARDAARPSASNSQNYQALSLRRSYDSNPEVKAANALEPKIGPMADYIVSIGRGAGNPVSDAELTKLWISTIHPKGDQISNMDLREIGQLPDLIARAKNVVGNLLMGKTLDADTRKDVWNSVVNKYKATDAMRKKSRAEIIARARTMNLNPDAVFSAQEE